jgi:hypothetical protein
LAFSENIRTTARLSDGNVVDKTGDEESPGELREVCRGDAEVLREQLRGVGEAGDAAVVVMQGQ